MTTTPPNRKPGFSSFASAALVTYAGALAFAILLAAPALARHAKKHSAQSTAPSARAAVGTPAERLVQAYLLGAADYSASAAVERLDAIVKTSRTGSSARLAVHARLARTGELAAYRQTAAQLRAMNAPAPVLALYNPAVAALAAPLAITETARQQLPGDADAQQVWSTLDEAERIAPPPGGVLTSWLKLARGRDALWAYHVGNLSAVIRAGIPGSPSALPLIHGTGALAKSAPPGCPKTLVESLKTVAQQANENKVTAVSLTDLDKSIQDVFGPGFSPLPPDTVAAIAGKR